MDVSLVHRDDIVNPEEIGWLHKFGGTPAGNYSLSVHRWFRFPAGFSAKFINEIFERFGRDLQDAPVLDPFAGTATTLVCAKEAGLNSIGIEAHPLFYRIGNTKIQWDIDLDKLKTTVEDFISRINEGNPSSRSYIYPELVEKCFSTNILAQLKASTDCLESMKDKIEDSIYNFLWLGVVCIIRKVSHVGTAPWQYVLPNTTKNNHTDVIAALRRQFSQMLADILYMHNRHNRQWGRSIFIQGDARNLRTLGNESIGFSVCSPPYLNNFDYSDSTRLETYVLREAESWRDISHTIRDKLIVSATTQVTRSSFDPEKTLNGIKPPIRYRILQAITRLSEERKSRGGKKNYDVMVARYFTDMVKVLQEMSRVLIKGSLFIMIMGDSAPYGVYIPTDELLSELALDCGFSQSQIIKLRDRNTRWNNRKHRVPLRESAIFLRR